MIQKISVLENLIELDQNSHELKHMATLLTTAANDWPSTTVLDIDAFIAAFKNYFGDPISVEQIESIEFNGLNAWQLESGKLIVQLLNRALNHFKIDDLDLIVSKIQKFYSLEFEKVDFIAEIQMFRTENGGIQSFVPNGYKPNLNFKGFMNSTLGELTFINQELLYAGEIVKAKVKLRNPNGYLKLLDKGQTFELSNARSVIGIGEIQQVVNVDIKKENWMEHFAKNSIFEMI